MFQAYFNAIRFKDWWRFIIPPVLAFYLWGNAQNFVSFSASAIQFFGLLVLSLAVASFGFFLNEWTDIQDDKQAEKINQVSGIPGRVRYFFMIFILIQLLLGSALIIRNWISFILLAIQITLLLLYSIYPFRLKKHIFWGPFLDAFYSGTIFYLLALYINYTREFHIVNRVFVVVFFWGFIKGIRNIAIHLMKDAEHDEKIFMNTIATRYDKIKISSVVIKILLPLEIILFGILLLTDVSHLKYFGLAAYCIFIFYIINREKYIIPYVLKRMQPIKRNMLTDINMYYEIIFIGYAFMRLLALRI